MTQSNQVPVNHSSHDGDPAARRLRVAGRRGAALGAAGLLMMCGAVWSPAVSATEVETSLIVREGAALPGTGGDPVAVPKSPFTNELGDLFLSGTLMVAGSQEGFVWAEPDRALFRGSQVPGGALMSSRGAASNSDEWAAITYSQGTHEIRSGHGSVVEIGDLVAGAGALHRVDSIYPPAMTADGTGYVRAKLRNQADGSVGYGVLRFEDGGAAAIEVYIEPDDLVDGYEMAGLGIKRFAVSLDGVHQAFAADLWVEGSKRNALVIDGSVRAIKGQSTGTPTEKWHSFAKPSVTADGSYLGPVQLRVGSSYNAAIAYAPSDAPPRRPRVLVREGDCVGAQGALSECVTLEAGGSFKTAGFDRPKTDGSRALAYVWVNPMAGPGAGDEYLSYICDAEEPAGSHVLLSCGDVLDLDGDGSAEAMVDRVGLSGYPEIAFGASQLYVGADLIIEGQPLRAVLGLARPDCGGSDSGF